MAGRLAEYAAADELALQGCLRQAGAGDDLVCRPARSGIRISANSEGTGFLLHKLSEWQSLPGAPPPPQGETHGPVLRTQFGLSFSIDRTDGLLRGVQESLFGKALLGDASRHYCVSADMEFCQLTLGDTPSPQAQALVQDDSSLKERLLNVLADLLGKAGIRFDRTSRAGHKAIQETEPVLDGPTETTEVAGSFAMRRFNPGRHMVARRMSAKHNGAMSITVTANGECQVAGRPKKRPPEAGVEAHSPLQGKPVAQEPAAHRMSRNALPILQQSRPVQPKPVLDVDMHPLAAQRRREFDAAFEQKFGVSPQRKLEYPIPSIIHRFWAGGAMSEQTMENLLGMAKTVKATETAGNVPWKQILWTSRSVNQVVGNRKLLDEQLPALGDAGVDIRYIEEHIDTGQLDGLPDLFGIQIANAINGVTRSDKMRRDAGIPVDSPARDINDVKYLSDLTRLAATLQFGGVYMDTDIGPGELSLIDWRLYHRDKNGEVPLAGPQVQNTDAYQRDFPKDRPQTECLLEHAADCKKPVFNFFFATRPKTRSNQAALRSMIDRQDACGMVAATAHFAGAKDPREWVVDLPGLAWTTSASDDLEGSP